MRSTNLKQPRIGDGQGDTPYNPPKPINIDNSGNYPVVENAGKLGEIVNKRWSEIWVNSNWPNFPGFDQMALDILIEDYNERHSAEAPQSAHTRPQRGSNRRKSR